MLQGGGDLDFPEEALAAEHGRQLGAQHLDGDLAAVLEVLGEVDGGHATGAEFALDPVAVGECVHKARGCGHFVLRMLPKLRIM